MRLLKDLKKRQKARLRRAKVLLRLCREVRGTAEVGDEEIQAEWATIRAMSREELIAHFVDPEDVELRVLARKVTEG